MGDFTTVEVKRNGDFLDLSWSCVGDLGKVSCYVSDCGDFEPEEGQLLWQMDSCGCIEQHYSYRPEALDMRPYFLLVAENGLRRRVAERLLPVGGVVNFRDLGGYLAEDGRRVKWGKLLRSAAHDGLTDQGVAYLQGLGLKTVVDYRSSVEVEKGPDREVEGVSYYNIRPLEEAGATNILGVMNMKMENAEDAMNALMGLNRNFMRSETALAAYHEMMLLAMDEVHLPMVQHCTAGKDRVGVGSATLLLALGVDEETIVADYLLSNANQVSTDTLKMSNAVGGGMGELTEDKIAMFKVLAQVHEEYLRSMLDEMKIQFGDAAHYLQDGLGISEAQLKKFRDKMLE